MHVEVIYTTPEAAKAYGEDGPKYATPGAAAIDLRAMVAERILLLPGQQVMVPTGLRLHAVGADGEYVRMASIAMPRSGRGSKEGLVLGNTVGLIDGDYQGEVLLCVWARPFFNSEAVTIEPGERIAQLAFMPVVQAPFKVVQEFSSATERGGEGFGSTGKG